jgi:hypothetical protein
VFYLATLSVAKIIQLWWWMIEMWIWNIRGLIMTGKNASILKKILAQ